MAKSLSFTDVGKSCPSREFYHHTNHFTPNSIDRLFKNE